MNTASIAEWVLSRFTTPGRAASIVGDLTENADSRGGVWFWFSVIRTALSLFCQRPSTIRFELVKYVVGWVTYFLTSNLITSWKWHHAWRGATGFILVFAALNALIGWRKRFQQRPRL